MHICCTHPGYSRYVRLAQDHSDTELFDIETLISLRCDRHRSSVRCDRSFLPLRSRGILKLRQKKPAATKETSIPPSKFLFLTIITLACSLHHIWTYNCTAPYSLMADQNPPPRPLVRGFTGLGKYTCVAALTTATRKAAIYIQQLEDAWRADHAAAWQAQC